MFLHEIEQTNSILLNSTSSFVALLISLIDDDYKYCTHTQKTTLAGKKFFLSPFYVLHGLDRGCVRLGAAGEFAPTKF